MHAVRVNSFFLPVVLFSFCLRKLLTSISATVATESNYATIDLMTHKIVTIRRERSWNESLFTDSDSVS